MTIRLHFKTPDVVEYALDDEFKGRLEDDELSEEQQIELEEQKAQAEAVIEKYVEYGENVTIEIDTESETATVVKRGR